MGCNARARTFADSPAQHVFDQAFAHTVKLSSAAFFHGDSDVLGDTYSARGHASRSNACTARGLVFNARLASTEESHESAIREHT